MTADTNSFSLIRIFFVYQISPKITSGSGGGTILASIPSFPRVFGAGKMSLFCCLAVDTLIIVSLQMDFEYSLEVWKELFWLCFHLMIT